MIHDNGIEGKEKGTQRKGIRFDVSPSQRKKHSDKERSECERYSNLHSGSCTEDNTGHGKDCSSPERKNIEGDVPECLGVCVRSYPLQARPSGDRRSAETRACLARPKPSG